MSKYSSVTNLLKNKFVIAFLSFVLWICFFDRNDVLTQWERKAELNKLETSKEYYVNEIETLKKELSDLDNSPAILEKFAREKFYLKRTNEDVFIVEDERSLKN